VGSCSAVPVVLWPGLVGRLSIPFLTLSQTPTGVYYSITQCRVGRASPNLPASWRNSILISKFGDARSGSNSPTRNRNTPTRTRPGLVTATRRMNSQQPGAVQHHAGTSPEATAAILKPDNTPDGHSHPRASASLRRAPAASVVLRVFDPSSVVCFCPNSPRHAAPTVIDRQVPEIDFSPRECQSLFSEDTVKPTAS